MIVDGKEIYRMEPGKMAETTPIKLEAGKKYPFKVTHLNHEGNSLGVIHISVLNPSSDSGYIARWVEVVRPIARPRPIPIRQDDFSGI